MSLNLYVLTGPFTKFKYTIIEVVYFSLKL